MPAQGLYSPFYAETPAIGYLSIWHVLESPGMISHRFLFNISIIDGLQEGGLTTSSDTQKGIICRPEDELLVGWPWPVPSQDRNRDSMKLVNFILKGVLLWWWYSREQGWDEYLLGSFSTWQIVANDTGRTMDCCSYATVTIHLLDINDHRPEFNQSDYKLYVLEKCPPGTIVSSGITVRDLQCFLGLNQRNGGGGRISMGHRWFNQKNLYFLIWPNALWMCGRQASQTPAQKPALHPIVNFRRF